MECKNCNSKDIEEDEARAVMICQDCGEVCEMTDIQGVTEFHEMDNGRVVALGKVICTQEAKQNTINKARNRIDNLCSKLSLNKVVADNALAIFKSALQYRLTRGKKASVMTGACVYLAARLNKQAIMLLDISDKISENVYTIGKVFNDIKTKFHQNLADIDPCLFIDRFAMQMELGDKREEVSLTGLKLLQRMKKDWISTGRRPSGVTAAALLIAARIHRFDRHYEDVARIAGISQHTVKKRLQEWAETATATLTLSEFKTIDYEEECNPPSFSEQSSKKPILGDLKITDEQFAKIQIQIQAMQQKLEEVEQENTENQHPENYFTQLVNSVEQGDVDITELLGNIDDDTSDVEVENAGRRDLIEECLTSKSDAVAKSMLYKLSKQEVVMEDDNVKEHDESLNDQLPMTMTFTEEDQPWFVKGSTVLDMTDVDENELISLYVLSPEESVKKLRWFFKQNNKFYRNKKIAREKKEEKTKKEKRKPGDDKSGKPRRKRQKSISEYIEEARQLMKQDPTGSHSHDEHDQEPSMKRSRISATELGDTTKFELERDNVSNHLDEDENSSVLKFEAVESVGEPDNFSDLSEHNPNYDYDSS